MEQDRMTGNSKLSRVSLLSEAIIAQVFSVNVIFDMTKYLTVTTMGRAEYGEDFRASV